MSRTSRNNMKNSSFFHIMVQGINKEFVFETRKNKERYLRLIYANNENVEIMAYCLMDNHAHILVKPNEIQDLQNWMRRVNTSYAIYYNRINERVGYVFRERYKSQVIKNEKHLCSAMEYIHNNPVKARICNRKEDYEFSSYIKIYQGNKKKINEKLESILSQSVFQKDNCQEEEEFDLIEEDKEDKNKICQETICDFLNSKNLTLNQLKKDNPNLIKIVKILKYKNKISYRLMEKCLNISREKLRNLIIK